MEQNKNICECHICRSNYLKEEMFKCTSAILDSSVYICDQCISGEVAGINDTEYGYQCFICELIFDEDFINEYDLEFYCNDCYKSIKKNMYEG